MSLITADEVLVFLTNEPKTDSVKAQVSACIELAQPQAENYAKVSFEKYTVQTVPADIKAALIKWAIAEYIAAYSSTNYVDGDGNFVDRASRCRKEAQRILDAYRPVVAL